jgi:glycosyltransferase involved in cell wall biosynthesis
VLVYFLNHSTAPVALGGAERSLLALVDEWRNANPLLEPYFLTKHPRGMFTAELDRRGYPYRTFPFRGWAGPAAEPPAAQRAHFARDDYRSVVAMRELMLAERPALVVTNTLVAPWAAFAAASAGIPHVWLVREYGDLDHGLSFQTSAAETYADIGRLSAAVVANSRALAAHLAPHIDADKLSWSHPRMDLDAIRGAATEPLDLVPFPHAEMLRVVVVGRVSPSKGHRDVVEAVADLRRRGVAVQVCFVGSSPETRDELELRRLIHERGVADQIVLAGHRDNPFPVVAAADVAVTASRAEAFGRTTYEYLALGVPVIATATGGSAEIVDGSSGVLVPPGDVGALATALARYAADRRLLARHAAGAVRRTDALAADRESRPLIDVLSSASAAAPAELPAIARVWFGLPGLISDVGGVGDRVQARFLAARVAGLAVSLARRYRARTRKGRLR